MSLPTGQAGLTLQTFSDGGARGNPGPAAIGVVICDEQGKVLDEASRTIGDRTNNQAEYEGLLLALDLAYQRHAKRLTCYSDSELLIYQVQGRYRIKNLELKRLAEKVKSSAARFDSVTFKQVPREHPMIARADKLLNQTLNKAKAKAPAKPTPTRLAQEELF